MVTCRQPVELSTTELFSHYVLPTYARFPLYLARGKGSYVWDEEGREYLDFGAGIAVSSVGHSHPRIINSLIQQAEKLTHTSNLYYTREQGLLAQRIVELIEQPGRVFFCNSGAEANEGLYKLARKFGNESSAPGRYEIITFENSFHGRTLAGISATGQDKVKKGFEPLTPGFRHARFNDLDSVQHAITPNTAAILLEPIQGESGIIQAEPNFLRGLRELCDRQDLLLMFDEIQCGWGRTGAWCGWKSLTIEAVQPDAVSWAKGMAAGFPMGAFWVSERAIKLSSGLEPGKLCDLLGPGSHGTTFGGTPLGCAVSLETIKIIEDENLLSNAQERGTQLTTALRELDAPILSQVRGKGLMVGIELEPTLCNQLNASPSKRSPSLQFIDQCQARGLLLVPSGTHRVRFLPPLNVNQSEIVRGVEIVSKVIDSLS